MPITSTHEPQSLSEPVQLVIDTTEPVNNILDEAPQCPPVSNWKPMVGSDDGANRCSGMLDMIGVSLTQQSPKVNIVERKPMSPAWIRVTDENGGLGAAMMHAMSGGTVNMIHANDIASNTTSITQSINNIHIDDSDNSIHENTSTTTTSVQTEDE